MKRKTKIVGQSRLVVDLPLTTKIKLNTYCEKEKKSMSAVTRTLITNLLKPDKKVG